MLTAAGGPQNSLRVAFAFELCSRVKGVSYLQRGFTFCSRCGWSGHSFDWANSGRWDLERWPARGTDFRILAAYRAALVAGHLDLPRHICLEVARAMAQGARTMSQMMPSRKAKPYAHPPVPGWSAVRSEKISEMSATLEAASP